MKKLSKESLQQFMLLHAEKLILGVCLVLTGVVIWLSLGSKAELDKTPQQLLSDANSAESVINADGAWEKLAAYRAGNLTAKKQIEESPIVDADKFALGNLLGTPAAALASRQDPLILAPEQLVATRLSTSLLMEFPNTISPLDRFAAAPIANDDEEEESDAGGLDFGGMDGPGGEGFDFGPEGGDPSEDKKKKRREDEEVAIPELEHGGQLYQVNTKLADRIRPPTIGMSPTSIKSAPFDIVCVTAVVDYKKQIEEFNEALADGVAYYPERDRPIYQFLQVERREVRGEEVGKWEDRSEYISYLFPGKFPKNLHKMPQKLFPTAPEVVAPENWDPVITGNIPAFALQSYEEFCLHPALTKKRVFPEPDKEEEKGTIDNLNGNDPEKGDVFDNFGDADAGSVAGAGGIGAGGMGLSGGGMDGGTESAKFRRRGSVVKDYEESLLEREAKDQYKLVRFFDLRAERDKNFEYRVRVWVGDPNHEDPQKGFLSKRGSMIGKNGVNAGGLDGGMGLGGMDGGMGLGGMDGGMGMGGMDGGMGMGGMGLGGDDEDDEDKKPTYTYRRIVSSMLSPLVRKRLSLATKDDEAMKKPTAQFFVSEFFDGPKSEPTKVELPPSDKKFAYIQYLRYARPSKWSEPVKVAGQSVPSRIVAGPAEKGRAVSINTSSGSVDFDLEEAAVDVVAAAWSRSIGAEIPVNKKAFVGETLNLNSPAYVLHPVNWRWVVAENPKADPKSKYIVPIRTNQTIVDIIPGETLDLPDSRKKAFVTPTETLVMDSLGNVVIANEFEHESEFRFLTATPDESRFIGRRKKKKKKIEQFDMDGLGM